MEIFGVIDLPMWLILLAVLAGIIYTYYRLHYATFAELGIPGPKPTPFLGNLGAISRKGLCAMDHEWTQQYGKVFGIYHGQSPAIVVADPDIVKQVLIKQFANFTNKWPIVEFGELIEECVRVAEDDKWKYLRSILSPTFSSGKLKNMVPLIQTCIDKLLNNLKEYAESGQTVNIKKLFGVFTLDVVASTAFSVQVDVQNNPNDPFRVQATKASNATLLETQALIIMIFPFMKTFFRWYNPHIIDADAELFLAKFAKAAIEERRNTSSKYVDFLQLMMNAHKDKSDDDDGVDDSEKWTQNMDELSRLKHKGMSEKEIIANSLIFLLAGFETTSNALTWTAFCLATHPDIQDRLVKEIDTEIGKDPPTYEKVFGLQYLDMVFSEVMRLYPPVVRTNRAAAEEIVINGLRIPKGMNVTVPIFAMHRDPDLWPDPMNFNPERFTPENKAARDSCAYLPFGGGPRICLGMRLAQLEARMAIVGMLQRFRFTALPDTELHPELEGGVFTRAKKDLYLSVEVRNS